MRDCQIRTKWIEKFSAGTIFRAGLSLLDLALKLGVRKKITLNACFSNSVSPLASLPPFQYTLVIQGFDVDQNVRDST